MFFNSNLVNSVNVLRIKEILDSKLKEKHDDFEVLNEISILLKTELSLFFYVFFLAVINT